MFIWDTCQWLMLWMVECLHHIDVTHGLGVVCSCGLFEFFRCWIRCVTDSTEIHCIHWSYTGCSGGVWMHILQASRNSQGSLPTACTYETQQRTNSKIISELSILISSKHWFSCHGHGGHGIEASLCMFVMRCALNTMSQNISATCCGVQTASQHKPTTE